MTMDYGLTPAEQAGRRAQQRGELRSSLPPPTDTRRATFAEYARQSPRGFGSPVVQTDWRNQLRNLQPPILRGPAGGVDTLPESIMFNRPASLYSDAYPNTRAMTSPEIGSIPSSLPPGSVSRTYPPMPPPNIIPDSRFSNARPGWTGFGQPPVGVGNVGGNYGSRLAGSVGGNYQPPVGNWRDLFRPSSYRIFGDALDPFQRRPMPTRPPTRYPTSGMPVEGF